LPTATLWTAMTSPTKPASTELRHLRFVVAAAEPLLCLGRHHGEQPVNVTSNKAHCVHMKEQVEAGFVGEVMAVHSVAVGNGQYIGAEFGIPLPGTRRRAAIR